MISVGFFSEEISFTSKSRLEELDILTHGNMKLMNITFCSWVRSVIAMLTLTLIGVIRHMSHADSLTLYQPAQPSTQSSIRATRYAYL